MKLDQPYQPSRRAQLEIPAEFTEPTVKDWLAALPIADADRCSDILLHGLRVLGRTAGLSPRARIAQLEGIRATMLVLLDSPASLSTDEDASFPLRELQDRRAHRSYCLCLELSEAYQFIALDPQQSERLSGAAEMRTLVLHRALESLSQAYLQLLENYQPVPERYWRTVYDLYREAVKHHVDLESVPGETSCATVFAQLMRIVLLSIANVYRFRPRETRQIYVVLGEMAEKAELCDNPIRDDQRAAFYLDLAVDAQPQPIQSLRGQGPVERRFIMTQLLVKWASKYYADAMNRRIGANRLSKSVLSGLLKGLSIPDRRKTKRFLDTGEYRIYLGIAALSDCLSGNREAPKSLATPEHIFLGNGDWLKVPSYTIEEIDHDEFTQVSEERIARDDRQIGWMLGRTKESVREEEIWQTQPGLSNGADGSAEYAPRLNVWLINSSATGYCLLWTDKAISGARVGELVGVESHGHDVHLGVIRWLNHNNSGDLMLGIELISPHAECGQVWPLNRPNDGRKALYVRANAKLDQPAMVLMPPTSFDVGLVIEWSGVAAKRILKLDRVQLSTPAFTSYVVSPASRGGLTAGQAV